MFILMACTASQAPADDPSSKPGTDPGEDTATSTDDSTVNGAPTWADYSVAGCSWEYKEYTTEPIAEPSWTERREYDQAGRIVFMEYTSDYGYTSTYVLEYDDAGCEVYSSETLDLGDSFTQVENSTRACDDRQRVISAEGVDNLGEYTETYSYTDEDGRITSWHQERQYADEAHSWDYVATYEGDELVLLTSTKDGHPFIDYAYAYTDGNLVAYVRTSFTEVYESLSIRWVYDAYGRMTSEIEEVEGGTHTEYAASWLQKTDHAAVEENVYLDGDYATASTVQWACSAGFPFSCEGESEGMTNGDVDGSYVTEAWTCD